MAAADVAELIAALRSGALSLDDVARQFRARTWTRSRRPVPQTYRDRADQLDPPLPVDGSIDDLTTAYDRGDLTWEQYRTLASAVADSINAEHD